MLKRLQTWFILLSALSFQVLPARVWASEGLDMPESLERKISLEGLSGIHLFIARTYNENLLLYAIICTVLMAVVGITIAFITDAILKAIGMEVEKIEHKE